MYLHSGCPVSAQTVPAGDGRYISYRLGETTKQREQGCRRYQHTYSVVVIVSRIFSGLLSFQSMGRVNTTPPQSASGGPTLWQTSGTSSRLFAKPTQHFRSWPCSSFWRYISPFVFCQKDYLQYGSVFLIHDIPNLVSRCWISPA